MHFLYTSKDWFFNDYEKMLKYLGNYHNQWTDKVYEYWIKKSKDSFKEEFYKKMNKFLTTKELMFSIDHQNIK